MATSARPETLDEKIARLEAARSAPSRDTAKETLAAKIARLESSASNNDQVSQGAYPTPVNPMGTRERIASALANGVDAAMMGGLDETAAAIHPTNMKGAYNEMKDLRQRGAQFDPTGTAAARALGTTAITIASMGANGLPWLFGKAAAPAAKASLGKQMLQAGGLGAGAGALSDGSVGDRAKAALASGVMTSLFPPAMQAGGWALSKVPGIDAMTSHVNPAFGASGKAADEIATRLATGEKAMVPSHPSLPHLALDEGGGNLEGLAANIVQSPGRGRTILNDALFGRAAGTRDRVMGLFSRNTGVTKDAADQVAIRVADAKVAQESAAQAAKSPVNTVNALAAEVGQPANANLALQQSMVSGQQTRNEAFSAARAATKGQVLSSPTMDAIVQTPAGKAASEWADQQILSNGGTIPTQKVDLHFPGFTPEQTQQQIALMRSRGITVDESLLEGTEVPMISPEKAHYMKRFLSMAAKNPQRASAMHGTVVLDTKAAASANGSLRQWQNIRNEMPEAWRAADDVAAQTFRITDAHDLGMKAANAKAVSPRGKAGLHTTIDSVEQKVAKMSPDERDAFNTSLRYSLQEKMRKMTPATVQAQLSDRGSELFRIAKLATGSEDAAARIATSIAAPELPKDISLLDRGMSLSESVPVVNRDISLLSPEDIAQLRLGRAAGLHTKWNAVSRAVKSPGSFFSKSPERIDQVGLAFNDPALHADFQAGVAAHDAAQKQLNRVTGGSPTQRFKMEDASRSSDVPALAAETAAALSRGRLVYGLNRGKAMLNKMAGTNRAAINEAAATMLSAPSLQEPLALAARRAALSARNRRGLLAFTGGAAGAGNAYLDDRKSLLTP